jgi:signal transduction histidine kinase
MDLAALLGDRLAAIYPIARRKAITLSLDAPGHVPVTANPTGLGSIIDNLIDNAIRYTPEGGNVRVSLREVGGDLELEVSDDGPGIAQEFRERVFERFFRVPGTAQEGSGLGLAIVKRLTTAYGGQIHLGHGPEGRGLTVRLALPAIARS